MDASEVLRFEQKQGQKQGQKVGTLKLSEAIRIGCPYVRETRLYSGCAIGTAYRVATGRDLPKDAEREKWGIGRDPYAALVAKTFGVPYEIVREVSLMHFGKRKTREECADWLASQGL